MKVKWLVCAALAGALLPAAAMADDPNDPAMRSAAARARDRAIIRQLNLREAAMVRERDARYAQGWRAAREYAADGDYTTRRRNYERDMANHAQQQAEYDRAMADWRRAVAACRAGDHSACDN